MVYSYQSSAIDHIDIAFYRTLLMLAYNLFHSFITLNIKPIPHRAHTKLHWLVVVTSDLCVVKHPPP